MKTLLISTLLLFSISGCHAQHQKPAKNEMNLQVNNYSDTTNNPKVSIRVNKQYDKDGKVISYDSSYSYLYANGLGQSLYQNNDTVFNHFKKFYDHNFSNFMDQHTRDIFLNDSLFRYDFFNDDFFRKRFELNQKLFEQMYRNMDSVKSEFLQKNYPKGKQLKNK